ncbi:hypothetical protein QOZ80_1BG0051280 [Eleusine coracana subsp. coracana]|nr:hypothetical protein QOZ80_1BG0051280 [Eleusine coracana subsp. coracana]
MAAAFSIRAYAESMRDRTAAELGPFAFAAKDLPPMEVRLFRWWEDELAAVKASEAEDYYEAAPGKGRAPKKRSISDLFAAAPPVDPSGSSGVERAGEDDEVLGAIMRRAKEQRRRRRLAEAAAAAVTATAPTAEAEPSSAGGTREVEANSTRQETLDETNLQDEMGSPESSEEPEAEENMSSLQKKVPDPKEKKHGKTSSLQKNKTDKLKYIESRKAIKVGKQRDLEKLIPVHSILKKYTKHTSVKMVKEKHRNPKRAGVIELCRKSVKRVKFSEANDVLGSNKQSSKIPPQLESLCKLFSDAMTSSSSSTDMSSEGDRHIAPSTHMSSEGDTNMAASTHMSSEGDRHMATSTDMSSEGDRHITAESSSSHMPEEAFTKAKKANENTDHENCSKLSNTGTSGLFDLNQALPESIELNGPYISNSEGANVEHTQDATFSMDEEALDNGRENRKYAADLDIRGKAKSHSLPNRFTLSNPDGTVQGVSDGRVSSAIPPRYADSGVTRVVPENYNASSSSRHVLRSGPVKLSAGAKHILMPSESTVDDNAAPLYSCMSFDSSNRNVSAPREKGVDFCKF